MASAIALGREIAQVLRRGAPDHPMLRHHVEPRPAQSRSFLGIVGQEADAMYPELPQHLGREVEPALIPLKAQRLVGLVGVIALRLQLVSADLVCDTNAAPLLV